MTGVQTCALPILDFDKKQWLEVIENTVPPKTIELNKAAFEAGYALV